MTDAMTETEWANSTDPKPMLSFARGRVPDSTLRLFLVACCRRVEEFMRDERCRHAVDVAEKFARQLGSLEELAVARAAFDDNTSSRRRTFIACCVAATDVSIDIVDAENWLCSSRTLGFGHYQTERKALSDLLRELVSYPRVTEAEWLACNDSSWMLKLILESASDAQLRSFACTCCRRIWEIYPPDWAEREFAKWSTGSEIRYVGPDDWENPLPRVAVDVAEAVCRGEADSAALQRAHEPVVEFAQSMKDQWAWVEYRRGDAGHLAEGDVAPVVAMTAAAARDASDPEIRKSVIKCAENAAGAIANRHLEAKRPEAIRAEQQIQAQMVREMFPWPLTRCG